MDVRVPLDNLGVPLVDFAAVLTEAARRWQTEQGDRYVGAVLTSLQWVAQLHTSAPATGRTVVAGPDAIAREQMAADAVVYGWPDAPAGVSREWALGVAAALGWVRGVSPTYPIRLGGSRRAA
ncbi:hypothetical protein GA0070616_0026 [Micromonospora nigra]|uniref:Uncharacterized protein n=1 Tax=Micromonospora nigra TaxID=145857 RepID=A0A1C6R7G1_9ACTN|nr:hypothetical protein [Micromonospora nigra]SCL12775.1 hypothetical protein GA0070616_0005 [Micromonospora nigra]SCL12806.1 hypothetical protein GA0070616_0026 [Micromonospora nigra]